jgi:anti-sigma B factor antagonist
MEVVTGKLNQTPLLEVRGDIDHNTCTQLATAFDEALSGGSRQIILDLSEVSYIDSGGLSVFFSAARELRPEGWLGVINPNPHVRRLFELVGLLIDSNFRLFDDRATAEKSAAVVTN